MGQTIGIVTDVNKVEVLSLLSLRQHCVSERRRTAEASLLGKAPVP
jgi:hypothetical protein